MADAIILLTLNKAEAETLMDVSGSVGGSPTNSRRRHVESIRSALMSAGVRPDEDRAQDMDDTKRGAIYFKNSR